MSERHHDGLPDRIPERVYTALEAIDAMPSDLRAVVHEFGYPMVSMFISHKITNPKTIRALIMNTLCGPRSTWMNRAGKGSESSVASNLDTALMASGSTLSFRGLMALLKHYGMTITMIEPNSVMVEASIAETGKHGLMSKEQKHKVRIKAAIDAASRRLWPWMYQ